MKKIIAIAGLALLATLAVYSQQTKGGNVMEYNTGFPKGDQGPKDYFTGTTWVKMLHPDSEGVFDT